MRRIGSWFAVALMALAGSSARAETTTLSERGPRVDLARVRDFGPTYYPPAAVHLTDDALVYREGSGWRCVTPIAAPRDLVTASGYVLASSIVSGGASWLVTQDTRRLRVLPVDCAATPVAAYVTPSDFLGATEGVVAASVEVDGSLVVATNERVFRVHPVDGGPTTLFTAAEFQAQFLTEEERTALAQGIQSFVFADVLALPSGALWFVAQTSIGSGYQGIWIVRRDGAGALEAVDVQRAGVTEASTKFRPRNRYSIVRDTLLFDPTRDLVFWQASLSYPTFESPAEWRDSLVVIHAQGAPKPQRIPLAIGPLALVTSTGDGVFLHPDFPQGPPLPGPDTPRRFAPLDFEGETDVDGDRLSFAEETALGTDDLALDSDGDGAWDPLEVRRFATDPASAGSTPALPPTSTTRFAFGSRLSEWPEFPNETDDYGVTRPDLAAGRAYCRGVTPTNCGTLACTGFSDYLCFDREGELLGLGPVLRWPSFGPDAADLWTGTDEGLFYTRDGVTEVVGDAGACTGLRCGPVWPVAPGVAFGPGPHLGGSTELRRYTPTGWAPVCTPEGCDGRFLGHDEQTGEAYVSVRASDRELVYAVAASGEISFLFDSWWLDAAGVRALRGDGGALLVQEWHTVNPEVSVRDGALRLLGERSVPLVPEGPRFRLGFDRPAELGFMHAPYAGAASGSCPLWAPPEVCSAPPGVKRLPFPIFISVFGEMIPVDDRVRAGDVVFWASTLMLSAAVDAGIHGGLWIHRESGATDPWISGATWERLGDEATRASLAQEPIRGARQINFSGDRARLCVATTDGRLFEWELTDGLPAAVRLVEPAAVHGCAYDAEGALVVLEEAGIRLATGLVTLGDPGLVSGRQLLRVDDRWLVRVHETFAGMRSSHVACLDAAGAELGRVPDVAGLTVEDGVVYWVTALDTLESGVGLPRDQQGVGHAAKLDDFCAGRSAERLSLDEEPTPGTLVNQMYEVMMYAGDAIQVLDVALARRPDGLVLATGVGADCEDRGGPDADGKFIYDFLWRLYPAYRPVEGHVDAHDAWRRERQMQLLVHPWVATVSAMALAPGATPADYGESSRYECLGRVCTPWTAPQEPPPVEPPDPPDDSAPPSSCGGCDAGAGSLSHGALLMLLFLVHRAREARARRAGRRAEAEHAA